MLLVVEKDVVLRLGVYAQDEVDDKRWTETQDAVLHERLHDRGIGCVQARGDDGKGELQWLLFSRYDDCAGCAQDVTENVGGRGCRSGGASRSQLSHYGDVGVGQGTFRGGRRFPNCISAEPYAAGPQEVCVGVQDEVWKGEAVGVGEGWDVGVGGVCEGVEKGEGDEVDCRGRGDCADEGDAGLGGVQHDVGGLRVPLVDGENVEREGNGAAQSAQGAWSELVRRDDDVHHGARAREARLGDGARGAGRRPLLEQRFENAAQMDRMLLRVGRSVAPPFVFSPFWRANLLRIRETWELAKRPKSYRVTHVPRDRL